MPSESGSATRKTTSDAGRSCRRLARIDRRRAWGASAPFSTALRIYFDSSEPVGRLSGAVATRKLMTLLTGVNVVCR